MKTRATFALLALALLGPATTTHAAEPATPAVTASDAWARATPPGMAVAAVYLTLVGGSQADRLVGAATPRAAMTQIHVVTEAEAWPDAPDRRRRRSGTQAGRARAAGHAHSC
ncbi:MAG: copper chaperone PCu(A)C [Proteobacteria bacterium]|nr:copper chaperone PCu(A)C [Pseudomonadota bacterium]